MNASPCPDRQEISAYLLGTLDEVRAEQLEMHLQTCPVCEQTSFTIEGLTDTLIAGLRMPRGAKPAEDLLSDPVYLSAVDQARAIGPAVELARQHGQRQLPDPSAGLSDYEFVGSYRLLERIGQGGMGTVYRAFQTRLDRPTAIKLLPADRFQSAERRARFEREMKAIGRLDHPHLVRAYDAGQTADKRFLFLAMEWLDGVDAKRLVERLGPLPIAEGCEIVKQAAAGLAYLHEQGQVHRDVKPSNLMLTAAGQVKVLDLGLALLGGQQEDELTGSDHVVGTLPYLAPEQAEDAHRVDHRADVYGLGCTLYHLLTGQPPYSGRPLVQVLLAHREAPIPSLCKLRPEVPTVLDAVFQKMVAKRPEERQQSMAEVIAGVGAVLDRLGPPTGSTSLGSGGLDAGRASLRNLLSLQAAGDGRLAAPRPDPGPAAETLPAVPLKRKAVAGCLPKWLAAVRRRKVIAAAVTLGFAGLALLGVIIFIYHPDGRKTEIAVEEGAKVQIGEDGRRIDVTLPPPNGQPAGPSLPAPAAGVDYGPGAPPPAIPPFDAVHARQHQEAWAKHLGVPVQMTNSIGMKFDFISPGEFDMGSTAGEVARLVEEGKRQNEPQWYVDRVPAQSPKHRVKITRPFYLGACEVTLAEYERVTGKNPSRFEGDPHRPVNAVGWNDALEFCRRLSDLPGEKAAGAVYRLPTEAQWEYACRAGTTTRFSFGDDAALLGQHAWWLGNSQERTQPVARLKPNGWGLFDMHGNVWEWCADWHAPHYYRKSPTDDPTGPDSDSERVLRWGSCCFGLADCHTRKDRR